jgi:hypothetical protein
VKLAAAHNPAGAQLLLDILRTAPEAVKRKPEDRYGPLGLMLTGRPPLPAEQQRLCAAFNEEWLSGRFSRPQLAEALEIALYEITGRHQDSRRQERGQRRTLAGGGRSVDRLLGDGH